MKSWAWVWGGLIWFSIVEGLPAYPLDAIEETGIRRLEAFRLSEAGELKGLPKQPLGALLGKQAIRLRLLDHPEFQIPEPDPQVTERIVDMFGADRDRYAFAFLDITDPGRPVYAAYNGANTMNPGSVGKILVGLALFDALAEVYPDDVEARKRLLRETIVTADEFIVTDHHDVRFWRDGKYSRRPLHQGDQASLWEYLDWMMSPSSNAAAAMVLREAMLLRHFGKSYPPNAEQVEAFFAKPGSELRVLLEEAIQQPVTRYGMDLKALRQGSFFTRTGKHKVPGTTSYASPQALMRLLVKMEQGKLVDPFSSLELKRLLYVTERRIRYASSPALRDAAVYFKSGSLYSCKPEPDFKCGKYRGNRKNLMNSVAIVESPASKPRMAYIMTLMSNVLRQNSAVQHQSIGTWVHRRVEKMHPIPPPAAAP